jgi:hypothetical protein
MRNTRLRAASFFAVATWAFIFGAPGPDSLRVPDASGQTTFQVYSQPQVMPDFSLAGLDGKRLAVGEHKGQVLLLNFWATW